MGLLVRRTGPSCPGAILALCVVLTTAGAFALLLAMDGDWNGWTPATCLTSPFGCFCERDRGTLVRQPSNTFSNLAFTVVGAVVLLECIQQQLRVAASKPLPVAELPAHRLGMAFACSFAVSQIILGAGSAWYHASLTFHGQWIDNAAMYLTVSAPLLYSRASIRLAAQEAHGGGGAGADAAQSTAADVASAAASAATRARAAEVYVAEYVTLNAALGYLCLAVPASRRYIFFVLLVGMLGYELRARAVLPRRRRRTRLGPLGVALAAFLVAFAVWTLDLRRVVCAPDSLLQGHALWHVLNGVATLNVYLYFHPIAHGGGLPLRRV